MLVNKRFAKLNGIYLVMIILCSVIIAAQGVVISKQREEVNQVKQSVVNKQTINNEFVTVEYSKVNKDEFDLIITPRNGMNIKPEFSLDASVNYRDAYLVGRTKKRAEQHYQEQSPNYTFEWNQ